jgi:hypothetical protein
MRESLVTGRCGVRSGRSRSCHSSSCSCRRCRRPSRRRLFDRTDRARTTGQKQKENRQQDQEACGFQGTGTFLSSRRVRHRYLLSSETKLPITINYPKNPLWPRLGRTGPWLSRRVWYSAKTYRVNPRSVTSCVDLDLARMTVRGKVSLPALQGPALTH